MKPVVLGETQVDRQGTLVVEVTPLHFNPLNDALYFGVAMNTLSVDLAVDIAKRATMSLKDGTGISAALWDGPAGGHHVSGALSFIITGAEIGLLLDTGTIRVLSVEVDVGERFFLHESGEK